MHITLSLQPSSTLPLAKCVVKTNIFYKHKNFHACKQVPHRGVEENSRLYSDLNFRNFTTPRFLVSRSAGLFSPSMKNTSTVPSAIFSQMKWYLISICLDHFSVMGFEAINIEPWLSPLIAV